MPKLTLNVELTWDDDGDSPRLEMPIWNSEPVVVAYVDFGEYWLVHENKPLGIESAEGSCTSILAGKRKILKHLRDNC